MEFKNLKSKGLLSLIQEQIKHYIIGSGLKSGELIPTEAELSAQLGISRTAIREALKGLETLGIIEPRAGVGRIIKKFNFEPILQNLLYSLDSDVKCFREVLQVRICLESYFISEDIHKFRNGDIEELRQVLKILEEQIRKNASEEELNNTHTIFHCKLYNRFGNSLLINLIELFSTISQNLILSQGYHTKNRKEYYEAHRKIVEAVEIGDGEMTKQIWGLLKKSE